MKTTRKRQAIDGVAATFSGASEAAKAAGDTEIEKLHAKIGQLALMAVIEVALYTIHTVLTDNGIQFADLSKNRDGPTARWRGHPFDCACWHHDIEHRLTKPKHSWTNGQSLPRRRPGSNA